MTTTPWIAVFAHGALLRRRVQHVLNGVGEMEVIRQLTELERRDRPLPSVVVIELKHVRVQDVLRLAEHAKTCEPAPALLLFVSLDPPTIWKALELARARCGQSIVYGLEELAQALMEAISRGGGVDASIRRLETAEVPLRPLLREIVWYCHTHENCPTHVGELAAGLKTSPRTMERRAHVEALPSPLTLLTWCKLLRATAAMEQHATRYIIATRGGFWNYAAFSAKFKEYIGESVLTVDRTAASSIVRAAMARAISQHILQHAESGATAARTPDGVTVPSSGNAR